MAWYAAGSSGAGGPAALAAAARARCCCAKALSVASTPRHTSSSLCWSSHAELRQKKQRGRGAQLAESARGLAKWPPGQTGGEKEEGEGSRGRRHVKPAAWGRRTHYWAGLRLARPAGDASSAGAREYRWCSTASSGCFILLFY